MTQALLASSAAKPSIQHKEGRQNFREYFSLLISTESSEHKEALVIASGPEKMRTSISGIY